MEGVSAQVPMSLVKKAVKELRDVSSSSNCSGTVIFLVEIKAQESFLEALDLP